MYSNRMQSTGAGLMIVALAFALACLMFGVRDVRRWSSRVGEILFVGCGLAGIATAVFALVV